MPFSPLESTEARKHGLINLRQMFYKYVIAESQHETVCLFLTNVLVTVIYSPKEACMTLYIYMHTCKTACVHIYVHACRYVVYASRHSTCSLTIIIMVHHGHD